MNHLLSYDFITEHINLQNITYILHDNKYFSLTGYKVLHSQEEKGFVPCTKVSYNGKFKLVYDISRYQSLASLLGEMTADSFLHVAADLFELVSAVKENGFLRCENILTAQDRIFLDSNNYKLFLIYLPVSCFSEEKEVSGFEKEIRKVLLEAIEENQNVRNRAALSFRRALMDSSLGLDELKKRCGWNFTSTSAAGELQSRNLKTRDLQIKELQDLDSLDYHRRVLEAAPGIPAKKNGLLGKLLSGPRFFGRSDSRNQASSDSDRRSQSPSRQGLCLTCVNGGGKVQFYVDRPMYVIGRKREGVDGCLSFNETISGRHCKILRKEGQSFLVDLNSSNGTYINGNRIIPGKEYRLEDGDFVRLSNLVFQVEEGRT